MNTNYIYNFSELDSSMQIFYYEKLRSKLYSVVYYLNKSLESLNGLDGKIISYYSINEDIPGNIDINSVRENIQSRVSYLNNTIIPSINYKINSIK